MNVKQFAAFYIAEIVAPVRTLRPDKRLQARLERPLVFKESFLKPLEGVPDMEPETRDRL